MSLKRPEGPVRVWTIVNIVDLNGKNREFSIQEIPDDRYVEIVNHLNDIFLRDEPLTASFDIPDDMESFSELQKIWYMILSDGITIAAYDVTGNPETPILAGLNLLGFSNDIVEKLKNVEIKGKNLKKAFDFKNNLQEEIDPQKMLGFKEYLSSYGLSVSPEYRRLGLAKILLETRDKIGREYNLEYTSTLFTGPISQKVAAHVGFEEIFDRAYDAVLDMNGQKLFPKLTGKHFKVMAKRLL